MQHGQQAEVASKSCITQPRISEVENSSTASYYQQSTRTVNPDLLNYKPIPLRWPSLTSLLLLTCSLLGLLEYARHLLPITRDPGGVPQGSILSPPMDLVNSQVYPVITGALTGKARRQATLSKKPPLSYPIVTLRWHTVSNKTTPQTVNGTGFSMNESKPEIPSILGGNSTNSTTASLAHIGCRSCAFIQPEPGNQSPSEVTAFGSYELD